MKIKSKFSTQIKPHQTLPELEYKKCHIGHTTVYSLTDTVSESLFYTRMI